MNNLIFTHEAKALLKNCGTLTGDAARLAHFLSQAVNRLEQIAEIAGRESDNVSEFQDIEIPYDVRQFWITGNRIEAIKRFRPFAGSLRIAKNYLEKKLG